MVKVVLFGRKTSPLEEEKVQQLMKEFKATDESEAIRTAINNRLFADAVMKHVKRLQRRGTVQDAYKRAMRKEGVVILRPFFGVDSNVSTRGV